MNNILEIDKLKIVYRKRKKDFLALDCVNLQLKKGEVLGIVGESGSGKSTLGLSVMRLLPPQAKIQNGNIYFKGQNICKIQEGKFNKEMRGKEITYIPQNPQNSLNPVFTVGRQLKDIIRYRAKDNLDNQSIDEKAVEIMTEMGIADAEKRLDEYPHQFSGGMKQRVLLSMAFVTNPTLLIADEPTTALDVTVEAQILGLLADLIEEYQSSIIYITHDLGVVSEIADRVAVFYAGRVIEINNRYNIFNKPKHPYTEALIECLPGDKKQKKLTVIPGEIPDLSDLPSGCNFHPRCKYAKEKCKKEIPNLFQVDENGKSACFYHEEVGR
ncbi:MAG: ABC transporter ATP-binding protein [Halanaerobiales bacterium]|nr:ABC transporter ATP-binding protein [Halanaerobiales bacterium]